MRRPRCVLSRAPVVLAAVMLPLLMATSCGGEERTATTSTQTLSPAVDFKLAASDVARLAPAASTGEVFSVAGGIGALGADLYSLLAAEAGDGNVVFSPASIVTALAMTYAGASGDTAREMAATLHFELEGEALHRAFNSLDAELEARNWERTNAEGESTGVLLKTANSLWAQQGLGFQRPFLDILAANYGAGVRLSDFVAAAEEARSSINRWVADETKDKIPELLAPGVVDASTRLVLVNAVYLDADWATQFDPDLTYDGPFDTLAGPRVEAQFMKQTSRLPYARGDGWEAVELPYLGEELAMLLLVPDEGRVAEMEGLLAGGLVQEAVAALGVGAEIALTMPTFEFRTQAGLNDALKALGMEKAFDSGSADFSGMTTETSLFISAVVHEAFIAVDEKGTEAAAATAVVMAESAYMPGEMITLTIDRPFIFALRDRETGTVLFLGRVADPTA